MNIKIKADTIISDSLIIFAVGEKVNVDSDKMFKINSKLGGKIEIKRKNKVKDEEIKKFLIVECKGYNYRNPKIFSFFPSKSIIIKHSEEQ